MDTGDTVHRCEHWVPTITGDAEPVIHITLNLPASGNTGLCGFHITRNDTNQTYHKKVETMTYPLNINLENTAKAIGQAIRHAKRVVVRDHIKADRMERVNQFVVSLRTKLLNGFQTITFASELVGDLCDKTLWHDIGELGPTATRSNYNHNKMSLTAIQALLDTAKRMSYQADAQSEEILGDLEELERELHGLQVLNDDADRINAEGEKLVEDLCLVFSDN